MDSFGSTAYQGTYLKEVHGSNEVRMVMTPRTTKQMYELLASYAHQLEVKVRSLETKDAASEVRSSAEGDSERWAAAVCERDTRISEDVVRIQGLESSLAAASDQIRALAAAQTKTDTHEQQTKAGDRDPEDWLTFSRARCSDLQDQLDAAQIKADKCDHEISDLRARLASSEKDAAARQVTLRRSESQLEAAQIKADTRDSENTDLRARLASSAEDAAAQLRRSESQLDAAHIKAKKRDSEISDLGARLALSEQALRRSEDTARDTESQLTGYLKVAKAEHTRLLQDIHRLKARIGRGPPVSHGSSGGYSGGYHYTCGESPLGFAFDRDGDERNWSATVKTILDELVRTSGARSADDCGVKLSGLHDGASIPKVILYVVVPSTPRLSELEGDELRRVEAAIRAGSKVFFLTLRNGRRNMQAVEGWKRMVPTGTADLVEFIHSQGTVNVKAEGEEISNRDSQRRLRHAVCSVCPLPAGSARSAGGGGGGGGGGRGGGGWKIYDPRTW
jgi:hypothetical protein